MNWILLPTGLSDLQIVNVAPSLWHRMNQNNTLPEIFNSIRLMMF